jgi:N6-adenosine-specific RNA methylase IME4
MADQRASTKTPRYRVALMDPPWATRTWSGADAVPTQADDPYPTMSVEDMAALPVGAMMARDSVIAMWVIGTHIDQAFTLARAWGFAYVTDLFYWAKQRLVDANQLDLFTGDVIEPRISMGRYTRKQVEPCLLFKRGRGMPVADHAQRQLIVAPIREHSRKPDDQYARIEAMFGPADVPGRYIEFFARTMRPGWAAWGNEIGKFPEMSE